MNIFKQNIGVLVFSSVLMLFFLSACEKETKYDVLTGELIGYVTLFDSVSHRLDNHSGVEVIFEGSNPQVRAITDKDGRFSITELKSGTYNLIYNKDGFCQHKYISYMFVGGNIPVRVPDARLFEQVNMDVDSISLSQYPYPFNVELYAVGKISNSVSDARIRYYLSDQPDVSFNNYLITGNNILWSDQEEFSFYIPIDTNIFPFDTKLYFIMYPTVDFYQTYIDINTGKTIYSSINMDNPSDTVSITITRYSTW